MKNEIAFETAEAALSTAKNMMEGGNYVVMLSREEDLWILNYEWSETCNRNDVVFMSCDDFYDKYCEIIPDGDDV